MMGIEDLQKEAMHTLIQIQKIAPDLFDSYMDESMNRTTFTRINNDLIKITSTYSNLSNYSNIIENFIIDENYYQELNQNNVVEKMIKYVEEKIEEYIYDTFDRYYIKEYGSYVYSIFKQ